MNYLHCTSTTNIRIICNNKISRYNQKPYFHAQLNDNKRRFMTKIKSKVSIYMYLKYN